MKMARRQDRKPAFCISLTIVLILVGCNSPAGSQNASPTPDARSQPQNPIPETEVVADPPITAAAMGTMPSPQSGDSENNLPAVCLDGISPGSTGKAEVVALLGDPVAAQQAGGYEALQYTSPLRGQYHTVYLRDQVVEWISIVLAEDSPMTWSMVLVQQGEPAFTAYSAYLQGSRSFAFPERGLNFVADDALDVVYLQECFVPVSLEEYRRAYGDFLLQADPYLK